MGVWPVSYRGVIDRAVILKTPFFKLTFWNSPSLPLTHQNIVGFAHTPILEKPCRICTYHSPSTTETNCFCCVFPHPEKVTKKLHHFFTRRSRLDFGV
ncbi:hypothetical protein CPT_Slocum_028 [Serratia phage Slocum]|nr:hypothetical protein CPT_Slocum_028 [Serratia phage Slocum]